MQQFTGMEYLAIDIANNFGLDKLDWNDRLDWFNTNESKLEEHTMQAKEPALFYAGVLAYRKAKKGEPIGYPISLDATASGCQLLACLTGDSSAARLANVLNAGYRSNAYTEVYKHMQDALGTTGTLDEKTVKKCVMTSLYGSKAQPIAAFGEDTPELFQFYRTMETLMPAVWELNSALLQWWDSTRSTYAWVMPDNFHVQIKVMGTREEEVTFLDETYTLEYKVHEPRKQGRSLGANLTHSLDSYILREMVRRCSYTPKNIKRVKKVLQGNYVPVDPETEAHDRNMVEVLWALYQDCGMLSARILDHIDRHNVHLVDEAVIQELLDSLPKKPFEMLTTHDCFRVLPSYGNDLRWQYANLLKELAKSDMLSYLLQFILGERIIIDKADPDMWKHIMDSNYALC